MPCILYTFTSVFTPDQVSKVYLHTHVRIISDILQNAYSDGYLQQYVLWTFII